MGGRRPEGSIKTPEGWIKSIITWAGRYYLVKGRRYILYDQGSIRQIMPPCGAAYGKLCRPVGRHNYQALGFLLKVSNVQGARKR